MLEHLELRAKIKAENLADSWVRETLYAAFGYDALLAREDELRAEYYETSRLVEEATGLLNMAYAENRLLRFREDFLSRFQGAKVERLLYLARQLSNYGNVSEQPRVLLDVLAPEFFNLYPKGEIWFVELNQATLGRLWEGDFELQDRYAAPPDDEGQEELHLFELARVPHEESGLESGVSAALWLQVMMFFFYPFVNGVLSSSDARRLFLFLPDQAINTLREYRFDLYREMQFELSDVYRDGRDPWMGLKGRFPEDAAVLSEMQCYFEWYIRRCSGLLDQLLKIRDVKQRFITTLTLNRLAVDTRMIETSDLPYLMKLLFFGALDKWANLHVQLGLEPHSQETEVWKLLLSRSFYEGELRSGLQSIPGRAGDQLRSRAEWIFDYLEDYGPSPEVIRELRNSYHGYGIKRIDTLLSHSGELHNDVPGLANVLWHWLLAEGLPSRSVSAG